jgi:hypothetical protein
MCRCLGVQEMSLGIVGRVAKERAGLVARRYCFGDYSYFGLVAQEVLLWFLRRA